MILNLTNALSANLISASQAERQHSAPPIVHFGVGGFHRAHQAWALQKLQDIHPGQFADWGICGVCIMPGDLPFVERLCQQDCLYFVQSFAANGQREDLLVSAIRELLHPSKDYEQILFRLAAEHTQVISFTITEGGYNIDDNKQAFIWENPAVQQDIKKEGSPQTVFRILAEGLRKRMEAGHSGLILMSCDNIQHNGDVLKFALLEFLSRFDAALIPWIKDNISFVKTMVDRITPATSEKQKDAFAASHELEDPCLVVCEDFFQWVIQKDPRLDPLPYGQMGATLVEDVSAYEKMKLRLLNGGHSLTGLLGYILGYDRIHTSIVDPVISAVYRRYCVEEVMETLDDIKEVSYEDYMEKLISRFSNPMINDSTARIIAGSTDKLPKFVLPVILDQLNGTRGQIKWGVLILAAWYCYLASEFENNRMAEVTDLNRGRLLIFFSQSEFDHKAFLQEVTAMAEIKELTAVQSLFNQYVEQLVQANKDQRRLFIQQLLETKA